MILQHSLFPEPIPSLGVYNEELLGKLSFSGKKKVFSLQLRTLG